VVVIKLADGKARKLKYIDTTTFWAADGKPISAAEFIKNLYGELPDLFKDEDELRKLWGKPDTRKALLAGLEDKGFGLEQLEDVKQMIDAEDSDVFDVLSYISFASDPISREERVNNHKPLIFKHYADPQQQFLDFVLAHYITEGVGELDMEKLPDLIKAKYQTVRDIPAELGSVAEIRDVFMGFQAHLYSGEEGKGLNGC